MKAQETGLPDPSSAGLAQPELNPIAGRIDAEAVLPPLTPPALSSAPTVGALVQSLRRRWMVAFTLGPILAVGAAVACWSLLAPSYTAFSQINVLPYKPDLGGTHVMPEASFSTVIKSQAALIKSRPILQKALGSEDVKRLGLDAKYPEPAQYLEKNLSVEASDSGFISIRFTSENPTEASAVVKAITDSYMDHVQYGEGDLGRKQVAELQSLYNQGQNELKGRKKKLDETRKLLNYLDKETLMRQREEIMGNVRDLRSQRLGVRMESAKVKSQMEAKKLRVQALEQVTVTGTEVEEALASDPIARPLLAKIDRVKNELRSFDSRGNSGTPTAIRLRQMRGEFETSLAQRRAELRVDLKTRQVTKARQEHHLSELEQSGALSLLEDQVKKLDVEIKDQVALASKISGSSQDAETQEHEILLEEQNLSNMYDRLNKLKIATLSPSQIRRHQEAELQATDSRKQLMAAGASPVAVLFLVCMGLAWTDFRKRRIHSASDVAQGLGLHILGAIPDVPRLEQHLLDLDTDSTLDGHPVLEAIDGVRTRLLHDAQMEGARVILVAGAGTGEGRTTLAGQLAASLARSGRKTLLIDGDLRRPNLHDLLDLPMQPGLSEALLGEVEPAGGVHQTSLENLAVMPAGQWDREVIHTLARNSLAALLEPLRQSYDFVIVDSHPLLEATDTLLMGQQVDAAILSVLRQVSRLPRVYTAYQRLSALRIPLLGVVVNGTDPNEVVCPVGPAAAPPLAA